MKKKIKDNVLLIIIGIFCGMVTIAFEPYLHIEEFSLDIFVYICVFLFLNFLLHVVVHEGGHCLFGGLCGFKFISFRIASYMWVNTETGIKFKRLKMAGTGGQCLMMPTEPDYMRYMVYNLGGGFANLLVVFLAILIGAIIPDQLVGIICYTNIIVGLLSALTNLVPLDIGVPNDGYNAYCMMKDRRCVNSLYQQLMLSKEFAEGKRIEEIDEKYFTLYDHADLSNPLNTCIEANRGSRLISQKKFSEAKECLENLLKEELTQIYDQSIRVDLLFIELLTNPSSEKLNEKLDKKFMDKMTKDRSNLSALLVQYGIDLLLNQDEEASMIDLKYYLDACKTYPYTGLVEDCEEYRSWIEERKVK